MPHQNARMYPVLVALLLTQAGALMAQPAPSVQAAGLQKWIGHSHDNRGRPYVIIDKRAAWIWIYDAQGRLVEGSPALLGSAVGDTSTPGIGERPMGLIRPHERTTPAGRFVLEPGHNLTGEQVLWIDYDAAVSLHRVRPGRPGERRLQRLASATPEDNRISYGCINLPIAVYNRSVAPLMTGRGAVAYVLPEVQDMRDAFPFLTPLALRQAPTPKGSSPWGPPRKNGDDQPLSPLGARLVPLFQVPPLPLLPPLPLRP